MVYIIFFLIRRLKIMNHYNITDFTEQPSISLQTEQIIRIIFKLHARKLPIRNYHSLKNKQKGEGGKYTTK